MDTKHLSRLGQAYADHVGGTLSTLSTKMAGAGHVLPSMATGEKTVTVKKFNRLMAWFSENWPSDLAWPDDIPRPVATKMPGKDHTHQQKQVSEVSG